MTDLIDSNCTTVEETFDKLIRNHYNTYQHDSSNINSYSNTITPFKETKVDHYNMDISNTNCTSNSNNNSKLDINTEVISEQEEDWMCMSFESLCHSAHNSHTPTSSNHDNNNKHTSNHILHEQVKLMDLDIWQIKMNTNMSVKSSKLSSFAYKHKNLLQFTNYFSIGVDAQIVYNFHTLRESSPTHFLSQWGNKLWYGLVGGAQIISKDCNDLTHVLQLFINNTIITLDSNIEGIIFSNIKSYGGGSHLWQLTEIEKGGLDESGCDNNGIEEVFNYVVDDIKDVYENTCSHLPILKSSMECLQSLSGLQDMQEDEVKEEEEEENKQVEHDNNNLSPALNADTVEAIKIPASTASFIPDEMNDGIIEILGVTGSFHLAQIKSNMAVPIKIAQISVKDKNSIRIITTRQLPMQVDGEPWLESACELEIIIGGSVPVLTYIPKSNIDYKHTMRNTPTTTTTTISNATSTSTLPGMFIDDDTASVEDIHSNMPLQDEATDILESYLLKKMY